MTFDTWLLFSLAYLLVTLSPGPNVLLVCAHAVKYGYRSIILVIAANLLCQLAIVICIALGIGAFVTVDSVAFKLIKYCGAGYLAYLGVKMIISVVRPKSTEASTTPERSSTCPSKLKRFREAFFVSAGNPKTVVFLAAFLPQFLTPTASLPLQFTEMFLTIALIVASIHAIYAFIALHLKHRITNHRPRKGTTFMTGGLFVFLGYRLSNS